MEPTRKLEYVDQEDKCKRNEPDIRNAGLTGIARRSRLGARFRETACDAASSPYYPG